MFEFPVSAILGNLRDWKFRLTAHNLPPHPYPEQFSENLDTTLTHWADRFVMIASTPRCGSTYLGHTLMQTGQCGVPMEYLHPGSARYWCSRFGTAQIEKLFPKFVHHRTGTNGTFSFKAHWSQFAPHKDHIDELTQGVGIDRIIWISRRDLVSQAISWVIAEQTGVWISGAPRTGEPVYSYDAIVEAAEESRNGNLAWHEYLSSLPESSSITVAYEDFVSDPAVRQAVSLFLDLSVDLATTSGSRTKRQSNEVNLDWSLKFKSELRPAHKWILEQPIWLR